MKACLNGGRSREDHPAVPLIARAGTLGLPSRIGLDTTVGPDGSAASGNAELVRLALHLWNASAAP